MAYILAIVFVELVSHLHLLLLSTQALCGIISTADINQRFSKYNNILEVGDLFLLEINNCFPMHIKC